jgi:hypothetical protein
MMSTEKREKKVIDAVQQIVGGEMSLLLEETARKTVGDGDGEKSRGFRVGRENNVK